MIASVNFGTTPFLKWRPNLSYAAIPISAAIVLILTVQCASTAKETYPALVAARSWSVLRVGMSVFTGGRSGGQTICPSMAALFALERGQPARCINVPRGVPAIVDSIVQCKRTDPAWGYESSHVRIHSVSGGWQGFTDAGSLQPDVPTGTLLDLERDWGAPLTIDNDSGSQTVIGGSALVRLLRYDPNRDASLYVEVLNGPYRGRRGWTFIQDANTRGVALGQYDMQYAYAACMP